MTGATINILRIEMAIVLFTLLHATSWPGYSITVCGIALSLPHAIPLKIPWIISTSDSEYLVCLPLVRGTYYPSSTACYSIQQCKSCTFADAAQM